MDETFEAGELWVVVPSRGRPESVLPLSQSFYDTCTNRGTTLWFVVDEDDPELPDYRAAVSTWWVRGAGFRLRIYILEVPGGSMVQALNEGVQTLLEPEYPEEDTPEPPTAIAFMGDDHRPRTVGWDVSYLEALRQLGGTGIVYGNDLLQGEAIPTQVAMSTDIPKKLGYFAPPHFQHLCIDLVWKDWGQGIERIKYLPEVIVEHLHPAAGKGKLDAGYLRVNSSEVQSKDAETYYAYRDDNFGLALDIRKLKELL